MLRGKHVHYIRKGDSFEGARLQKLREKKLKKMFITPEDEKNYRTYVQDSLEAAYDPKSNKSLQTRVEVIHGSNQTAAEEVFEKPEDKENYELAKKGADQFVEFLMRNEKVIKSVISIENTDQNLAHHGVTVSTLAVALAQKLGTEDPKILKLMALGALLHDVGHTVTKSAYDKPLASLTPEELATYKTHSKVGANKVKDLKHFDPMVIDIIHEHEEYMNGTGYPQGLMEKQINKTSLIVGVCNSLDRLLSFEGIDTNDAMKQLIVSKMGLYPLEHMNGLKSVLVAQGFI